MDRNFDFNFDLLVRKYFEDDRISVKEMALRSEELFGKVYTTDQIIHSIGMHFAIKQRLKGLGYGSFASHGSNFDYCPCDRCKYHALYPRNNSDTREKEINELFKKNEKIQAWLQNLDVWLRDI